MSGKRAISHLFFKLMVLYGVAFSSLASAAALWIARRDGLELTGLPGIILTLFGGELLMMCMKAILSREKAPAGNGKP